MSLQRLKLPKIKIIGIGGGGCLILKDIAKKLLKHNCPKDKIEFVGANVDWQALKSLPSFITKFYFGESITHGFGCGMNPELGEKAAKEAQKSIQKLIQNANLCVFIGCLGGGCGSGATPIFAQTAYSLKIPSLGIFTFPFKFEGKKRYEVAQNSYQKIKQYINANVLIENQKIFKVVQKNINFVKALSVINEYLANAIGTLIETLYLPGLINIDFSDLKSLLNDTSQNAYLLIAETKNVHKPSILKDKILANPLFEYPKEGCKKILFNIFVHKQTPMKEIESVSKDLLANNKNAKIIYGISYHLQDKNKIKILFLGIGKISSTTSKLIHAQESISGNQLKPKKKRWTVKKASKQTKKPHNKSIIKEKSRTRRNGLDVQKLLQQSEKELFEEEKKWEIPAFLRRKTT